MSSYFSERTAEYSILPPVVAYLAVRFGRAAPMYFWSTREGNSIARELHQDARLRVLAIFARRPKVGRGNDLYGKLNVDLFDFAHQARVHGVPTVAAFPAVKDIFGLGGRFHIHWLPLEGLVEEDIHFQVDVTAPERQPTRLGGPAMRTLTLDGVGDILEAAPILAWNDAMNAIQSSRRSLRFDGMAFYGRGGGYTPAYVLVPA